MCGCSRHSRSGADGTRRLAEPSAVEEPIALYREVRDLFERDGMDEPRLEVRARRGLATVLTFVGEFNDAEAQIRAALELLRRIGDDALRASLIQDLGDAYLGQARFQDAIDVLSPGLCWIPRQGRNVHRAASDRLNPAPLEPRSR